MGRDKKEMDASPDKGIQGNVRSLALKDVHAPIEDPHLLSAEMAGEITKALLEFNAINRLRQLANELMKAGVTFEKFHAWNALSSQIELGVSQNLSVDVMNLLSTLQKGIDIRNNSLVYVTPETIKRTVKRAITAQAERIAEKKAKEDVQMGSSQPSKSAPVKNRP